MKTTPVNKLPEYTGPRTHRSILQKIYDEAQTEGKDISLSYIQRVVYLFFSANGFPYYFKLFRSFALIGIGRWLVTRPGKTYYRNKLKKKKERSERLAEKRHQKRIAKAKERDAILAKRKSELKCHAKLVDRFNALNADIISRGFTPWTWEKYCIHKKKRKWITWGTIKYNHWDWK